MPSMRMAPRRRGWSWLIGLLVVAALGYGGYRVLPLLKKGGVMDDDFIDAYIDLKMEDVMRVETTPHPAEFDMYYKY